MGRFAVPENVQLHRDVVFGVGGGRELKMHLATPKDPPGERLPAFVWVHGGGWQAGNKESGLRRLPELVVSRHPDGRVDVGLLNLGDGPRPGTVDLARLGLADGRAAGGDGLTEYWTGRPVELRGTLADVGVLPRHSARVIRLEA